MNEVQQNLHDAAQRGEVLDEIRRMYLEDFENHKAIAKEVAIAHNEGIIDVITEYQALKEHSEDSDFFGLRQVFEDALPYLEAPVADVISCMKHLVTATNGDMTANWIFPSFAEFCKAKAGRPDEVLDIALADIDESFDFISVAIVSGAHFDKATSANKAIELCKHDNLYVRSRAVYALGRIDYGDEVDLICLAFEALEEVVGSTEEDMVLAPALRAVVSLPRANDPDEKVLRLISGILEKAGDQVRHAASECLFYDRKNLADGMVEACLESLIHVNIENTGTLRNIDYALSDLLKKKTADLAIDYLEKLILQNDERIALKTFSSLMNELQHNQVGVLNKLITRWFLLKNSKLARHTTQLVRNSSEREISVEADLSQITGRPKGSHIYLARKACGWFFMYPKSAAGYMLSLVETAPNDEVLLIRELLFYPLLMSYSKGLKEYLENFSDEATGNLKQVIQDALGELNDYHEELSSTGTIAALHPVQSNREAYWRYYQRLMDEAHKKAPKGIFTEICATSVLLYGNSSIHYIHRGDDDAPVRQVVPMASYETSVEFPSLENVNPHSLHNLLLTLKLEECDS